MGRASDVFTEQHYIYRHTLSALLFLPDLIAQSDKHTYMEYIYGLFGFCKINLVLMLMYFIFSSFSFFLNTCLLLPLPLFSTHFFPSLLLSHQSHSRSNSVTESWLYELALVIVFKKYHWRTKLPKVVMHAASNVRPVSECSCYSHGTQPEMLTPDNVSVYQQEQKADREKWVARAWRTHLSQ